MPTFTWHIQLKGEQKEIIDILEISVYNKNIGNEIAEMRLPNII